MFVLDRNQRAAELPVWETHTTTQANHTTAMADQMVYIDLGRTLADSHHTLLTKKFDLSYPILIKNDLHLTSFE